MIHSKKKNQSIEVDPQTTKILELAEKDIKIPMINMLKRLLEKMDIMGENMKNYRR